MASLGGFYAFSPNPTWSSFHPVGNIPPVDLTEGQRLPPSPELLLLGCGDIRSLLYTAHVLHTSCPPPHLPGALDFHLNDIEAGILARDLVLLRLASSGEATHFDSEDARFLWSVWYECLLRSDHATRLRDILNDLIDDVTKADQDDVTGLHRDDGTKETLDDVTEEQRAEGTPFEFRFGNDATRSAIKEALAKYSRFSVAAVEVLKGRNDLMMDVNRSSDNVAFSTERIASVFQEQQGCMKDPQLRVRCRKEIEGFVRTGMTSVPLSTQDEAELRRSYTGNPTYFRPGISNWVVAETACVFLSRDLDLSAAGYDGRDTTLSRLFFKQMVEHVRSFQALQRQGVKMTFTLWHGEALELSNSVLPASLKFDVINTSNVVDNVGLLNLLVMYAGRLRPETGLLTTQSFYYAGENNFTEYIQKQVPAALTLFPTILGVTFAGEEKLAKCTTFRLGSFVGREATQFYWKSTPKLNEKVDLTSGDLQTALQTIFVQCAHPQKSQNFFRTVDSGMQTFLLLIRNFFERVESDAENPKALIDALIPSDVQSKYLLGPIIPSLQALVILQQKQLGYSTDEKIVEVFLPVEVVSSKDDLHQCTMALMPYENVGEMICNAGNFLSNIPMIVVKDFHVDVPHKRIRFYLPERTWESMTERYNAFFESVKVGQMALINTVRNVKKAARVVTLSTPSEKASEGSSPDDKKTSPAVRRGIKALRLVENEDHFCVTIQAKEGQTWSEVSVQSGRKPHQVKVTSERGRSLLWKAELSCNVLAEEAAVTLRHKDASKVEVHVPKDPMFFDRTVLDHRPIDARNLETYEFNSNSELTLYLHFWRMFPGEKKLVAEEGLPGDLSVTMATRDLMLEVMHVAIHKPWTRVITVETTRSSKKVVHLALELHGFKALDGSPALIVTLVYPNAADVLCKTGKLRPRDFDKVFRELLVQPRYIIEASTLQLLAVPLLVHRLYFYRDRLKQEAQKDDIWVFQSFIRPNHISFSWMVHYGQISLCLGDPTAVTDLALRACHREATSSAYSPCCPRDSFSAMCLKCLLASGRDFHHMKKNPEKAVKEMTSVGILVHHHITEHSERAIFCTYCKSQQNNPHKCSRCRTAGYCSEECRQLDSRRHSENCDPTRNDASGLLDAAETSPKEREESPPMALAAPFPTVFGKVPQNPGEIFNPVQKKPDDSSVSWWTPGVKIEKSTAQGLTPDRKTKSDDLKVLQTKGGVQRSNATGRKSASKSTAQEESSVSWWATGTKVQSSGSKSRELASKTKPEKSKTNKSEDDVQRSNSKGHKPAQTSAKVQSSVSQGSTRLPGQETPACSEKSGAISDAILEERGIRRCDVCGKASGHLKRCGRCRSGSYCSSECQSKVWKEHRKSCNAST